ncbi:MAG: aldehyde dehydrogenase family protein [Polyangiales bacterium]
MTSPSFPEVKVSIPATPIAELDAVVEKLAGAKLRWVQTKIPERIALLRECLAGLPPVAADWVRDMCAVKGLSPESNLAGEEWIVGPATTARNIRILIRALEAGGQPKVSVTTRPNGQSVARVLPADNIDKLLFAGFSADLWIEPGKPPSQGRIYREPSSAGEGKVALVLGAGNVSSIPPMDLFYKLFVENEVVVLKMNPVNAVVGPHLARAFKSLVDAGFLAIVYGGAEVGSHLANHPQVDTLHVTGSDRTYDAIVWGSDPEEQKRRKAENKPINTRPFSAELGCVTPVMVVPGDWNEADLEFQARQVASMVTQNASFNCNAAKVLVTAKGWNLRDRFLERVHKALASADARKAYYPGAEDRYSKFVAQYPNAKPLGAAGAGVVPWTVIPDVPAKRGEYALTNEAFCGVLAEVALDASTPDEFLSAATKFANDDCWGTLSCMLIVDDGTQRRYAQALDQAVEQLRYGGIAINAFAGMIYAVCTATWGAFPGHPQTDIQSGSGVVHNALLFDYPQKTVLRAPFRIRPTPAWFYDHRNLKGLGQALLRQETEPGLTSILGLAFAGVKG